MTQTSNFWDNIAEDYAKSKVRDPKAYQTKLEMTQALFPAQAEVLEIACGTGTTALYHAPYVQHYLATDISAKMLEIAQQKATADGVENVTFKQLDVVKDDLPKNHYDAILAMSILHLVRDRPAVLAKAYQSLKPGGVFVSSTICLAHMAFVFPLLIRIMKRVGKAPNIVDSLSHDALAGLLSSAGFEIEAHHRMSKGKVAFIIARKPI